MISLLTGLEIVQDNKYDILWKRQQLITRYQIPSIVADSLCCEILILSSLILSLCWDWKLWSLVLWAICTTLLAGSLVSLMRFIECIQVCLLNDRSTWESLFDGREILQQILKVAWCKKLHPIIFSERSWFPKELF